MLLAALYSAGFESVAHGPMAQDVLRDGGDAAIARALAWLVDRAPESLEPTIGGTTKTAAFNITVLSQLLGTPLEPDLDGHVLMLEEVSEARYRIDAKPQTPRSTSVVALDDGALRLVRELAGQEWNRARFLGLPHGADGDYADLQLLTVAGEPVRLSEELAEADFVMMIATGGRGVDAASTIGDFQRA